MKIILSRKGFDSSSGGIPSPIFPDGTLFSLPIPDGWSQTTYAEINVQISRRTFTAAQILDDLSRCRREMRWRSWANENAHLDPDLRASALPRDRGWRPLFGPGYSVQKHLDDNGVGVGDLFLFFGWFRQTEWRDNRLVYSPGAPDLHLIFGWLRVGEVWRVGQWPDPLARLPAYALDHPHAIEAGVASNTIYAAASSSEGGHFASPNPRLQLTAPGACTRSVWQLPGWFYPTEHRPPLSCHPQRQLARGGSRWQRSNGSVRLASVGRGQEFVLDTEYYPEALDWAEKILSVPVA